MQTLRQQRAFSSSRPSRTGLVVLAKESRIGRAPVPIAKGVTVTLDGNNLKVKVHYVHTIALECHPNVLLLQTLSSTRVCGVCRARWAPWSAPSLWPSRFLRYVYG